MVILSIRLYNLGMNYQKTELYFLLSLLVGVCVLTFFIFQPFLNALVLAVIFATAFSPVHKRILAFMSKNSGLAAFLSTGLVLIAIVVPLVFLSIQIFKEATQLYASLVSNGGTVVVLKGVEESVRSLGLPFFPAESLDLGQYVKQGLSFLIQNLGTVFSNVARVVIDIFVLLVVLYYLFKDGSNLRKSIIAASPLQDVYDETILRKLELAINSVVKGNILVGLIQGTLTAIGLAIFGVPNPVLWGSFAAIAALVPGFGTSLVLVPSILFLFFTGETTSAFGLATWWICGVALVDNVLGPKLVSRGIQLHPFLILLSILGGISLFGPLGLLFGPLVISLLFAFLEVHSSIRKEHKN